MLHHLHNCFHISSCLAFYHTSASYKFWPLGDTDKEKDSNIMTGEQALPTPTNTEHISKFTQMNLSPEKKSVFFS